MKIRFVILCFIVFALFACNDKQGNWRQAKAFRSVRKKMKNNPSEALALLDSDSMLDLKSEDIAYYSEYQLLKAEAYYLNNCWQDDVDLQTSANYYDSISNLYPKNEKLLLQKSKVYYYFGINEFEKGNYQNAVSHHLKALQNCSSKELKALIYNELYKCFSNVFCYKEALECANRANYISNNDSEIDNNIKYCLANISLEEGNWDEAMDLFVELLKSPGKSDVSEYEYGIAKCFFIKNEIDSAVYHYEFALSGDEHIVAAAAADLVKLYRDQCDTTDMFLKYSDLYFSLRYDVNADVSANSKMITMFHDFCNNEIIDKEHVRKKQWNYYVLIAVIIFIMISLYLLIRYKNRKENEIDLIRKSIESHKNYIEKARRKSGGVSFAARLNDFENCAICISLKDRLSQRNVSRKTITDCYDCALDNRENSLLSNNANHCFPDFSSLLVEDLGVKGENITYCCLCLLGFSIIEIAVLMKISYQAAHKRLVLIKETLKIDGDIKDFLIGYFGDIYC